jgi:ATP-dependent Clp protease ATP-binding subunit ClpA
MFQLPDGIVAEAKLLARELAIRKGDPVEKILLGLLVRRNDLLMVALGEQRVDGPAIRRDLEPKVAAMPVAETTTENLKFLLNQAVVLGTRLTKSVSLDHLTLAILENHPNPASRILEAAKVRIEDAKRLVRNEITADGSPENPEMTARRLARRIQSRCRIQFTPTMLNKLWILAEQYLPGPNRNQILRSFLQTIAAEAMQSLLPQDLRNLQIMLTEAKMKSAKAEALGSSSTRRRTIEDEIKHREYYLRTLADWIEAQKPIAVSDDAVRSAVSILAKIAPEKVDLM